MIAVNILAVVAVHGGMVAAEDNGGIFVKILLLEPLDEGGHLPAGAAHDVGILVIAVELRTALAHIPVLKVGVHGQHGEVKGLRLGGQLGHLLPGELKELLIFIAPPYMVVLRDEAVLHRVFIIHHLVIPVLGEVELPPSEGCV